MSTSDEHAQALASLKRVMTLAGEDILELRATIRRLKLERAAMRKALKGVADFDPQDSHNEGWRDGWCWCGGSKQHTPSCRAARAALATKPAKNPANRTNSGRKRGVSPAKRTRKR